MADDLEFAVLDLHAMNVETARAINNFTNESRLLGGRLDRIEHLPAIRLSLFVPPRQIPQGFVFGSGESCDVRIFSNDVAERHFAITFQSNGLLLLQNKSTTGTVTGDFTLSYLEQTLVIEHFLMIRCGNIHFEATAPNRGQYQSLYQSNLNSYLGCIFTGGGTIDSHATPIRARNRIGRYIVLWRLGKGDSGKVSLLVDKHTGHFYAGKIFRRSHNADECHGEMNILYPLFHENIVRYVDRVCGLNDVCCLVTEYLRGHNILRHNFSEASALIVLRQCLQGLQYIHSCGIIHGDIKPANIMVRTRMPLRVCIVDFGDATREGETANYQGTQEFAAPEIWNKEPYDSKVDIWALGLTALELFDVYPADDRDFLAGPRPGNRERFLFAVRKAYNTPRLDFARTLLSYMLHEDPRERWTARDCLLAIEEAQGNLKERNLLMEDSDS
ncbi:Inactive serine/threonine-protein kinase plk5 [Emydomyces testavorans]|uniref:non-specific serine/threonine protein kinase n=1 Tax=Emydomyces testavorans TaxID=2070801 RepID=A0AAF0DND6_9EURO|nr:Inactive serine/threonine-protein kinase plk5 [Emydomyces testavorans]